MQLPASALPSAHDEGTGPPLPLGSGAEMVVSAKPPPCSKHSWGAYWIQWPQDKEHRNTRTREKVLFTHSNILI